MPAMRHFFHSLLLSLLLALPSCVEYCDIESQDPELLVINMLASPDSVLSLSLTHSWPHSLTSVPDVTVTDAVVTVSVNSGPDMPMSFDHLTRRYILRHPVAEGDSLHVSACSIRYGEASASTRIPSSVRIDRWSFTPVEITDPDGIVVDDGQSWSYLRRLEFEYSITFTDPVGEENYYLLACRPYYDFGGGTSGDPILSENDTPLEAIFSKDKSFIVFSDRNISGRTYTLTCTTSYIPYIPVGELAGGRIADRISLCSISRDYYLYLLSLYKKYGELNVNLENLGLTEPKAIYTNVHPGIGIFASQSADTILNDVHDLVLRFAGIQP